MVRYQQRSVLFCHCPSVLAVRRVVQLLVQVAIVIGQDIDLLARCDLQANQIHQALELLVIA